MAGELAVRLAAIIPNRFPAAHRIEESVVIGLGSYLVWKFVAAALLALHLLNTYIYFGKHPFWNYVNATAQTLLRRCKKSRCARARWISRRWWESSLIFFAAELAERGLVWLYARLPF